MTELTTIKKEDSKIYSEIFKSINQKRKFIIQKINIWILILGFLLLLSLLISAIYTKNNIFYFFITIPIITILILPIILIKIDSSSQIKDIEKFISKNNEMLCNLLNKKVYIKKIKIKTNVKMYSKNKNFTNEIINQAIRQLREL